MIVGIAVGGIGAWLLLAADRREWTSGTYRQVVYGALALAAFATSDVIGGNGFIAAFVAGIAFRRVGQGRIVNARHLTEGLSVLMSVVVWLLFGAVLAGTVIAGGVVVAAVVYALVSLTLVRMVPVAIALPGRPSASRAHRVHRLVRATRAGLDRVRVDGARQPRGSGPSADILAQTVSGR